MDTILINELTVQTHIGITDEERSEKQTLKVSVELFLDTKKASASDDIADTINYEAVCNRIQELGSTERKTIEKFAEDVSQMILTEFKPQSVSVTVKKFILPHTKDVSVTISRP